MTSSCVICATTRCTAVRQTTIITQKRQQHQPLHQQQYGINNNVLYNKNKIMMINNTSNNQLRYNNNNRTATAPILKKYYSTNSNTNKSLAKAISSSSNSSNNEQDNIKSIGNLLLGTAFVTSTAAALLAYNNDDNIVHADSVMATVPPVASFQVSSSRGKQQQNQSLSKDEGKKTLIMEEKKNDATEEVHNTNKVSGTTTTTNTTTNENNNGIQMKDPNNQRKYNVSIRALRGGRLYMEDEYYVSDDGHFAGVFDGHGGHGVSSYLKNHLYNTIQTTLQSGTNDTNDATDTTASKKNYWDDKDDTQDELDDDEDDDDDLSNDNNNASIVKYSKAIQQSITKIDNDVLSKTDLEHQGSTAVAIYLHEDIITNQRTILSANVGDSRAILSRRKKAIDLTRDHKPNEEKERNRILAMGETIEWDPFSHVYRVRNLSLSRAIGDKFAKPAISGEAEMKIFPLWEDDDEFIVLASDGLWDVMNSQDVINFVHRRINAPYRPRKKVLQQSTDALIVDLQKVNEERKRLMSRYVAHEALLRGSADNICVVIVWLKDL